MIDLVYAFLQTFGFTYFAIASSVPLIMVAEIAFPREGDMAPADRLRVILFAALAVPVSYPCWWLLSKFRNALELEPLISPVGFADVIIAVLLADLLYYWFHRSQHSIGWM